MNTGDTNESALMFVRTNYPNHKVYNFPRIKDAAAAVARNEAISNFMTVMKLQENPFLSGSKETYGNYRYEWHTANDNRHAVFHCEDWGACPSYLVVAGKNKADLDRMRDVLIQVGLIPSTDKIRERRAEVAANRTRLLNKKGIKPGVRITNTLNGRVWFSGLVTDISQSGFIEITIDTSNVKPSNIGQRYKIKPGKISKSMIS